LQHATGFSMDELHVLIGLGLQLLFARILGSRVSAWRPWLIVFGIELANEVNDLFVERWPQPAMQFGEGLKDILSTMMLPTLLLFTARMAPGVFCSPIVKVDEDQCKNQTADPPTK
jgi:hypothetical protein